MSSVEKRKKREKLKKKQQNRLKNNENHKVTHKSSGEITITSEAISEYISLPEPDENYNHIKPLICAYQKTIKNKLMTLSEGDDLLDEIIIFNINYEHFSRTGNSKVPEDIFWKQFQESINNEKLVHACNSALTELELI